MKALFTSINLIGDGLYISPALRRWHQLNPQYDITIETIADHVTPIYSRMGVPVTVVTSTQDDVYDFYHTFDVSKAFAVCDRDKIHVAEGYAQLLGVDLIKLPHCEHLRPIFIPTPEDLEEWEKGLVLVSMFSASCTSRDKTRRLPPNKMLPWPKWPKIIEVLYNTYGEDRVRFIGAPTDRAPTLPISEDRYMTGIPLNRLALIMRQSQLVLTIDNGMGHLAASQGAKQILFYPACLGLHYILPEGNQQNLYAVQIDPVDVDTGILTNYVRQFVKQING